MFALVTFLCKFFFFPKSLEELCNQWSCVTLNAALLWLGLIIAVPKCTSFV